jgi:hypothetical protein
MTNMVPLWKVLHLAAIPSWGKTIANLAFPDREVCGV